MGRGGAVRGDRGTEGQALAAPAEGGRGGEEQLGYKEEDTVVPRLNCHACSKA